MNQEVVHPQDMMQINTCRVRHGPGRWHCWQGPGVHHGFRTWESHGQGSVNGSNETAIDRRDGYELVHEAEC